MVHVRAGQDVDVHCAARSIKRPTSESRSLKSTSGSCMIDASSVTYRLSHSAKMDLIPPSCSAGDFDTVHPHNPDCSDVPSPLCERRLRPLRTTTLIRVPYGADFTSIAMLHLHQLHSALSQQYGTRGNLRRIGKQTHKARQKHDRDNGDGRAARGRRGRVYDRGVRASWPS
jgi:hypothetical protein